MAHHSSCVSVKMSVFWNGILRGLVTSQKRVNFVVTTMRTSNLTCISVLAHNTVSISGHAYFQTALCITLQILCRLLIHVNKMQFIKLDVQVSNKEVNKCVMYFYCFAQIQFSENRNVAVDEVQGRLF
jgi:hypothetical protein